MVQKFGKSRAERIDRAFRDILKLREKFGFPEVQEASEITDNWHFSYGMPYNAIDQVRVGINMLKESFGRIPWPAHKEGKP